MAYPPRGYMHTAHATDEICMGSEEASSTPPPDDYTEPYARKRFYDDGEFSEAVGLEGARYVPRRQSESEADEGGHEEDGYHPG